MLALYSDYRERSFFPGLDGLRAIAIIAVIWHHAGRWEGIPILARGFLGVDLFFVLSGFLIVTLLLREKDATGRIALGQFWMRRALRLVPVYFGLLVAIAVLYATVRAGSPSAETYFESWWVYALYLSNWIEPGATNLGPTWSLATEEQFYAVWPLLESFVPGPLRAAVYAGFLGLNQLVNFGLLDDTVARAVGADHGLEILDTTFTPILLGVGLAHGLHRARSFALLSRLAGLPLAGPAVLVLLVILCGLPGGDLSGLHRLAIQLTMTALIGAMVLSPGGILARGMAAAPIAHMGRVSYGMYLFHLWVMGAVLAGLPSGATSMLSVFVLTLAGTYGLAAISFHYYEAPILRLRRYFRHHRSETPTMGAIAGTLAQPYRESWERITGLFTRNVAAAKPGGASKR